MKCIDMVDAGSGKAVDLGMVQQTTASGRDNCLGSSNGMKVEAQRRTVKR
jgi:hypothetical protein